MRGLYAIADVEALESRGLPLVAFLEAVLEARPAAVQLRDKGPSARAHLARLREASDLCERAGVPLFANDRPDLACLAGAFGVHVGQLDLPVELCRRAARAFGAPSLAVGLSTHDAAQVEAAIAVRPDYVAIGPVFPTQSKANPDPVLGHERAVALSARVRASGIASVAIGGIDLERAAALAPHFDAVAVIGALLPHVPRGGARAAPAWLEVAQMTEHVRQQARELVCACSGTSMRDASAQGGEPSAVGGSRP